MTEKEEAKAVNENGGGKGVFKKSNHKLWKDERENSPKKNLSA